jgi:hypothetical protein
MRPEKFQLNLKFADRGPETPERLMNAEGLLRDELGFGTVEGNDLPNGGTTLWILTEQPAACLQAALRLLRSIQVLPVAATYQSLQHDPQGRAVAAGPSFDLPLL